jgi:dimethylglycine dehydrogenase
VKELGGQMGAYAGWERANWFAKPGDDTSEEATQTWNRAGPWEPRIREECEAVRDHVGVLDLPGFSRFDIEGPGATEWLMGKIAGGSAGAGAHEPRLFPRRARPHPDRDVRDEPRSRSLHADHRRDRAMA